ncbi:MAG: ABC transporter ATP-binding protein [Hyphomicrobiaceae bacterium]
MALLEVSQLDAWYGPAQALFGVTLCVDAGQSVVVLGRNGAGKSTTLKAIMGLEVRRRGAVAFDGTPIVDMTTHEIARLGLGYVPEDRRIFKGLTVDENLAVGRQAVRDGKAWTPKDLFQLFPNLGRMRNRLGSQMSGGEQQMLTIARTLMGNPRCILLDEPSEGLAPVILDGIAEALLELRRRGVGLLVSEQNLGFARRIAERAYVIESGEIKFAGTMGELEADEALRAEYLAV